MAACGLPDTWPVALDLLEKVDMSGLTDLGSGPQANQTQTQTLGAKRLNTYN